MEKVRLVVLSGPSGAGKSTSMKVLEDLGFYCVDNMPVALLPNFLEILDASSEITKAATVIDIREGSFLSDFPEIFLRLKEAGYGAELIYLDAKDDSLVKRFSETRRRHPLAEAESPLEGIGLERELLGKVRALADRVIDTTNYNVHDLKNSMKENFASPLMGEKMIVSIMSFGYRYGLPTESDMVIDVRFLKNPYFVESLKSLDGLDTDVRDFVLESKETEDFLNRFKDFLEYLIPLYWKEGKSYLSISVGCTGGRHRSVVITEFLAGILKTDKAVIRRRHRDMDRP